MQLTTNYHGAPRYKNASWLCNFLFSMAITTRRQGIHPLFVLFYFILKRNIIDIDKVE